MNADGVTGQQRSWEHAPARRVQGCLPVLAVLCAIAVAPTIRAAIDLPVLSDPRLQLSLFAAEPDIVTPIGIAVDKQNRVFVVESHTHFPKRDYPGPKYDRVKIFQDTDGDGKPDRISVFADGLHHSMNLAFSPDGQLYLTHRNGVLILRDRDGDGVSESRATVLELETAGAYPHNGIGGIAFSPDGWLYVGLGENLGENYTLKGSDGSRHSGGGEGGNIFRCRPDGSQLQLVATGFWNPFAFTFLRSGHLLAVDNDPDSRPPCRLLDVVEQGDYGFKFRYGRSGLHPFTAWNGELPGTLPMVAGTGEAPSGILECDRARWPGTERGAVLVTSWGDHFLELYRPTPFGASLRAEREIVARGGEWFRPVAIATRPQGDIYFTDWVDRDYSVHGKGRIWRLTATPESGAKVWAGESGQPRPNPAVELMQRLSKLDVSGDYPELVRALSGEDPFLRSAAISALARPAFREQVLADLKHQDPSVRLGALLALRRARYDQPAAILAKLLADPDERIRLMALVWIGEEKLVRLADRLPDALSAGPVSPALFHCYSAAAEILAKAGAPAAPPPAGSAARVMLLALEVRRDNAAALALLSKPAREAPPQLRLEAVRTLAEFPDPKADELLTAIARDGKSPVDLRTEAILVLAARPVDVLAKLADLLDDSERAVQIETARAFRQAALEPRIRLALQRKYDSARDDDHQTLLAEQLELALFPPGAGRGDSRNPRAARPASDEQWRAALGTGGDADSGRRVFFHPAVGCARCHRIEDHGGEIGPNLSTIAISSDREKLMQSILHPSREIAPQFALHLIETTDHESYAGLLAGQGADGSITLTTVDGKGVLIPASRIVSNQPSTVSLMPEGLENALTVQDFRDLLAFLRSLK